MWAGTAPTATLFSRSVEMIDSYFLDCAPLPSVAPTLPSAHLPSVRTRQRGPERPAGPQLHWPVGELVGYTANRKIRSTDVTSDSLLYL